MSSQNCTKTCTASKAPMDWLFVISFIIVVIGALNWGAVALMGRPDPITKLMGVKTSRIVFGIVGIAGILAIVTGATRVTKYVAQCTTVCKKQ